MKKLLISISLITLLLVLPLSSMAVQGDIDYQTETLFNSDSVRLTANAITAIKDLLDQNTDPVVYETLSQSLDRSNGYAVTVFKDYVNTDEYVIYITNASPYGNNYFYSDKGANNYRTARFFPMFYYNLPGTSSIHQPNSVYKIPFAVCVGFNVNNNNITIKDNQIFTDISKDTYITQYSFTYDKIVYSNSCPCVYSITTFNIYTNYTYMGYEDVYHTVTWLNMFDEVILITNVKHGEAATPPEVEQYENYYFRGWDKDFSYVTSDMTIKTVYEFETGFRRFRIICDYDKQTLVDIKVPKDSSFLEIFTAQKCVRYDEKKDPCYIINTNVHPHNGDINDYMIIQTFKFKGFFLTQNERRPISKYFVDFNITSDVTIMVHYEVENDYSEYINDDGSINYGKYIADKMLGGLKDLIVGLFVPDEYFFQDSFDNLLAKLKDKADFESYNQILTKLNSFEKSKKPSIDLSFQGASFELLNFDFLENKTVRFVYDASIYATTFIFIFSFSLNQYRKFFNLDG